MSLQVNDSSRRGRSRSPSGRERSSTRIERSPSGRDRERVEREDLTIIQAPYPTGGEDDDDPRSSTRVIDYDDYRGSAAKSSRAPDDDPRYRESKYETVDVKYGDGRREKEYRYEKDTGRDRGYEQGRDRDRGKEKETTRVVEEDKFAYLPAKYAKKASPPDLDRDRIRDRERERDRPRDSYDREYERTERTTVEKYDRERPRPGPKRRDFDSDEEDNTDDDDDDLAYGHAAAVPTKASGYGYNGRDDRNGRDPRDSRDPRDTRDPRDPRDPRIVRADPRDARDARDPRSSRESQDLRDPRDPRDPRNSRESYDLREERRVRDDRRDYDDQRVERTTTLEERKFSRDSHGTDRSNVLAVDTGRRPRDRSRSPMPTKDMARLSVNTLSVSTPHHSGSVSVSAAPGSPLLESYHGTYQSMSPMPSPLMLASHGPLGHGSSDVEIMHINGPDSDGEEPLSAGGSGGGADKIRRRARFYDPEADAERLAKALRGERNPPDTGPLIEILPGLTHDQVMELRIEYKRIVKTGPERKGVNIAKHIRARLKDEDPALMKACYSTALGRWESEAYWANFWYHGDKTRRELLIESLMGRTNTEIRHIKESFSDKKYSDSLTKCMRTELKEDKFKRAVLFVLDEQRMEEVDRNGRPLPLDRTLVEEDVVTLHKAVIAEKGGETAMINVVVQRSDTHLREVLRIYSSQYRSNFARDCLKKSGNLVGEMLAHILNGVINKPVRDALLVHHALTTSKRDELRRELLISRLVRFHWDRHHMAAIKVAYRERYSRDMQEAIRDATGNSDWGLFCRELCITRTPDEIKRVERIEIRHEERRG